MWGRSDLKKKRTVEGKSRGAKKTARFFLPEVKAEPKKQHAFFLPEVKAEPKKQHVFFSRMEKLPAFPSATCFSLRYLLLPPLPAFSSGYFLVALFALPLLGSF
jgi:hypothetical protein